MISDSDIHLFKLNDMLKGFTIETKDFKSKTLNVQLSQNESNARSSASVVVLRDSEEITIRDSLGPAVKKGRPKSANRIKSKFGDSLSQKEVKHRTCENY